MQIETRIRRVAIALGLLVTISLAELLTAIGSQQGVVFVMLTAAAQLYRCTGIRVRRNYQ